MLLTRSLIHRAVDTRCRNSKLTEDEEEEEGGWECVSLVPFCWKGTWEDEWETQHDDGLQRKRPFALPKKTSTVSLLIVRLVFHCNYVWDNVLEEIDQCGRFVFESNIEKHQRETIRESRFGIETNKNRIFQTSTNKANKRLKKVSE